jgi:GNAT superfamily N-acetyltransferase
MAITFRRAGLDDAVFHADVFTRARPAKPRDPVVERYWWENPDDNWIAERFVMEREGRAIGVATCEHPRWEVTPERFADIGGELLPEHRDRATLQLLHEEMEDRATTVGATRIAARADEDDRVRIEAIAARGFHEDRRHRRWELDLVSGRQRIADMAAASRERMSREGVRILTLAEDADPDKYRKVWRLSAEADQDIPTTLPMIEETLDDYMRWFRAPDIHEDRFWIAREGDDIVGLSVLDYPPVRGIVGTAWTATARRVRGRGIARALKCETLIQAVALGVGRVRTGNDGANDPILHINASMGYQPWVAGISFLKDVPAPG